MRAIEIIERKRDGLELSAGEIRLLVEGYTRGEIADYQMSAFLMAAFIRGLSVEETAALAAAVADSGLRLDMTGIPGPVVDKHSTGGVGDKTTLVVAPLAAALGLRFAKTAGRGLGFTGGTIDKLQSIPGFRVDIGYSEFQKLVEGVGVAVIAQTPEIAPADGLLYSLRDVTATVGHPALIAASIMGKKIAGGAKIVVLDVKFGSGAFMKTPQEAERLAGLMAEIGRRMGIRVGGVVSNMDQPLGRMVGNSLEVREAMEILEGKGDDQLSELCVVLVSILAEMAGMGPAERMGGRVRRLLEDGSALRKFKEWVSAQGGDPAVVERPELLRCAPVAASVNAGAEGYITRVDARTVGEAVGVLGARRRRKGDEIDRSVGVELLRKVGDRVSRGEPLLLIHSTSRKSLEEAMSLLGQAVDISDLPTQPLPHILARI